MALNLKQYISGIKAAEPLSAENLTIFPLTFEKEEAKPFSYLLLDEALQAGRFDIGEISDAGNVNTVMVSNRSGQPVLILDGEEIVGAKQNRMVNASMLIPGDTELEIPVSCVERGRWHLNTAKFSRSATFGYSTLRRQKAEQVAYSLRENQCFAADQGAIWNEIDRKQASSGIHSETDALHDLYVNMDDKINDITAQLKVAENQYGCLVFINNRFACLDLFDQPQTLSKLWTKLVKSYAVEALEAKNDKKASARPDPDKIIEAVANSDCIAYPSVGLGRDLRLTGTNIIGAGLALDERIIHLSVFEKDPHEQNEVNSRISRPTHRRRNLS